MMIGKSVPHQGGLAGLAGAGDHHRGEVRGKPDQPFLGHTRVEHTEIMTLQVKFVYIGLKLWLTG